MRYLLLCLFLPGCRQRAGQVHDLFNRIVYVTLPKGFVEDRAYKWVILDYDEAFFRKQFISPDTSVVIDASGSPSDSLPASFSFSRSAEKLGGEGMRLLDTVVEKSDSGMLVSERGIHAHKGRYYCLARESILNPRIACVLEIFYRGVDTAAFWKLAFDISHSVYVVPGDWKFRRGGVASETSVLIGGHAYGSGAPEK